jgi:hypothetical protein
MYVIKCDEIQKPPFNHILPKIGINRNITWKVVFLSTQYGGLGFGQMQHMSGNLQNHNTAEIFLGC